MEDAGENICMVTVAGVRLSVATVGGVITVRKQAAEIQQVGTEERISYAEALRRVNNKGRKPDEEQGIGDGRGMEEKGRNQPEVQMDKRVLFLA